MQGQDKQGDGGDAPKGSHDEAADGVGAAEAEGGELAAFDERHEPTAEKVEKKYDELTDDQAGNRLGAVAARLEEE